MKNKKIGIITGARSDFGLIEKIINLLDQQKEIEVQIYVTGMHLLREYGYTIEIIHRKFQNIIRVPMYEKNRENQAIAISKGIKNFSEKFLNLKPDIILITGDRIEMLAAGIAAATQLLPIAHIHGGDISENAQIDEQIRHSLTKFSHIHFPASILSKQRILQMGEEPWRVHLVGSPELDLVFDEELYSKQKLFRILDLDIDPTNDIILLVEHPSIYEASKSGTYMKMILKVLEPLNKHIIIIYPNNDPGSELIIKEIENLRDKPHFHIYQNLPRKEYLSLMKHAKFMIGNSSSGIIESTTFHLPVINIGMRNLNREAADNVITVKNDIKAIREAIAYIQTTKFQKKCENAKNPYGNGQASQKIVNILQKIPINKKLLKKKFVIVPNLD